MTSNIQKILLINPFYETNYPQPPLGLAMIASVLVEKGYKVRILDLPAIRLPPEALHQVIINERPDLVGITSRTPQIDEATKTAEIVKKIDENIPIILGGAHGTILPEKTMQNNPSLDIVVRGEGEETILEVVEAFNNDGKINFGDILGITYWARNSLRSNPERPPILELDSLPFPAFHLLPMDKYRLHPPFGCQSPAMSIITSRGCPYRCIFCSKSVFGRKYSANSADYVLAEIKFLIEKFGIKEIKFYDDVFTLDKKRIMSLCKKMKDADLGISWSCETRVNLVDSEVLKIMKSSGCYMVEYGVESGNQTILNNLRKDTSLPQITSAFKLTKSIGIDIVAYFMIGSPGETQNSIKDTIDFAKEIDPDFVQFSLATPYPGTDLYKLVEKEGYVNTEWKNYIYADLNSLDSSSFKISNLSPEVLKKWNKKAYFSFYLRGNYILKRLRKITSIDDLKTSITGLLMLLDLVK